MQTTDKSVSDAIKVSKQISTKKNIVLAEKNIETTIIASKFDSENGQVSTSLRFDQFMGILIKSRVISILKKNYREVSIMYINQANLTVKNNKRIFYGDRFLLGPIIKAIINPPENISNYVCKDREVKIYRPCCDIATGQFLSLYETIGYLMVRGDDDEHVLSYGYFEKNILYSYHKRRIPNSFVGTLYNRHRLLFETGQLQTDFSNLYYFLPSIIDRSESINQRTNSVNLMPTDIPEKSFEVEDGVAFDPSKLEISGDEKK